MSGAGICLGICLLLPTDSSGCRSYFGWSSSTNLLQCNVALDSMDHPAGPEDARYELLRQLGYTPAVGSEHWALRVPDPPEFGVAYNVRRRTLLIALFLSVTAAHLDCGVCPTARYHFILDYGELMLLLCGLPPLAHPRRDGPAPLRGQFAAHLRDGPLVHPLGLRGQFHQILEDYLYAELGFRGELAGSPETTLPGSPRWWRGTAPTQLTSRLVNKLADMTDEAVQFMEALKIYITAKLEQALLRDFPVAACLGVNLLRLAGSAGFRDTLEMHVGELMAGGLVGSDLAAARAVSRAHCSWIMSSWLRLQRHYTRSTVKLLVILVRSVRDRVTRVRALEESCVAFPRPWPYSVPLLIVSLTPQAPSRVRNWALYGQGAVSSGVFTDLLVQDIIFNITTIIYRFRAEWIHSGRGALARWLV